MPPATRETIAWYVTPVTDYPDGKERLLVRGIRCRVSPKRVTLVGGYIDGGTHLPHSRLDETPEAALARWRKRMVSAIAYHRSQIAFLDEQLKLEPTVLKPRPRDV